MIPPDVSVKGDWNKPEILDELKDSGITLEPIQAQALHVMGLLFLNFESAGHSLCFDCRLAANYYLQSYLLACTAIELLGRCKKGKNHHDPQANLRRGIDEVGLSTVPMANYPMAHIIPIRLMTLWRSETLLLTAKP